MVAPYQVSLYSARMETIKRAIHIVGSARALANLIGVSQQAVHLWKHGETQLLARHAVAIEKVTEGQVTAREIGLECAELLERKAA